jgi:xylulokinase
MPPEIYLLTHDIGTTGNKTCLYRLPSTGESLELVASSLVEYPLYMVGRRRGAKADDWWQAVCQATRTVTRQTGISGSQIQGMAFCAQMQGLSRSIARAPAQPAQLYGQPLR